MKPLHFLSKTDEGVIKHCTASTKNIQASLGFFVLLTGVMALISGTYAISNMFIREDPITHIPGMPLFGWPCSIFLGLLYCVFIMAIDREIVSASNKIAALLRLPLAIIISLIVSTPMEMQLFDARLVTRLQEDDKQNNKALSDRLESNTERIQAQLDTIEKKRIEAMNSRSYWTQLRQNELVGQEGPSRTGKIGKGDAYNEADQNVKAQDAMIAVYEKDLVRLRPELHAAEQSENTIYYHKKSVQAFDFLSKSIALGKVKEDDKTGSASRTSWGITILFFLFETIPCIVKLLLPRTEYDVLLEKRRLLNILSADRMYEDATSEYYTKSAADLQEDNPLRIQQMLLSQSD